MTSTMQEIQQLREKAYNLALEQNADPDQVLDLEAGLFEELLGNWLIENREYIPFFKGDEGWREELEDLLPSDTDWDKFMQDVETSLVDQ